VYSCRKRQPLYFGRSWTVNRMSQTLGSILSRRGAASRPVITGIERARTIRSGCRCGAVSTASRPCTASPQTSKLGWESNKGRTALRINALSSTSSTLVRFRHGFRGPLMRLRVARIFVLSNPTLDARPRPLSKIAQFRRLALGTLAHRVEGRHQCLQATKVGKSGICKRFWK
jgi:hypothetical protein